MVKIKPVFNGINDLRFPGISYCWNTQLNCCSCTGDVLVQAMAVVMVAVLIPVLVLVMVPVLVLVPVRIRVSTSTSNGR